MSDGTHSIGLGEQSLPASASSSTPPKAGRVYAGYIEDAEREGETELAELLREVDRQEPSEPEGQIYARAALAGVSV